MAEYQNRPQGSNPDVNQSENTLRGERKDFSDRQNQAVQSPQNPTRYSAETDPTRHAQENPDIARQNPSGSRAGQRKPGQADQNTNTDEIPFKDNRSGMPSTEAES